MVYSTNNEQGLSFDTWHHDWIPVDQDGITLIRRRNKTTLAPSERTDGTQQADKPITAKRRSNIAQRRKYKHK